MPERLLRLCKLRVSALATCRIVWTSVMENGIKRREASRRAESGYFFSLFLIIQIVNFKTPSKLRAFQINLKLSAS